MKHNDDIPMSYLDMQHLLNGHHRPGLRFHRQTMSIHSVPKSGPLFGLETRLRRRANAILGMLRNSRT